MSITRESPGVPCRVGCVGTSNVSSAPHLSPRGAVTRSASRTPSCMATTGTWYVPRRCNHAVHAGWVKCGAKLYRRYANPGGVYWQHPFGAWLANDVAINSREIDETVRNINVFRATNGEEMHGFAWQSLRLLAFEDRAELRPTQYGMMVAGKQAQFTHAWLGPQHAMRICFQEWRYSPQSRDDCAHGVGHGMFYYYNDIGEAVKACWSDELVKTAPVGVGCRTCRCYPHTCSRPCAKACPRSCRSGCPPRMFSTGAGCALRASTIPQETRSPCKRFSMSPIRV
jgi:hypothetical protein